MAYTTIELLTPAISLVSSLFIGKRLAYRRLQLFGNSLFKKGKICQSLTQNSLFWKFVAGLSRRVGLRRAGCRGTVCQLLLAEGLDLLVLGKRYAADLEYIVCAVQGAFPRVLTGSWDDSIRRH